MEHGDRLWSIWQRGKMAAKVDKVFGKFEQKSPEGVVVLKMWWMGRIAVGWHLEIKPGPKPVN